MSQPSLLGRDHYSSPEVFEAERSSLFHREWFYLSHVASIPRRGTRTFDLAGESVVVSRDGDGNLHAFANVCRHRGAALCDPSPVCDRGADETARSIRCPYHGWTYGLDGDLLATPRVEDVELGSALGLWRHRIDVWNGLVFVALHDDVPPLADWVLEHAPSLASVRVPVHELHLARRTHSTVAANWKIVVENYLECLHCPIVHPELVDIVPLYRTGAVVDPSRPDGAVELAGEGNSFSYAGTTPLPLLPDLREEAETLYRGAFVFPNLLVDITGTGVVLTAMFPVAADRTELVGEYLFAPDAAANTDPDVAAAVDEVIEFNELVGRQDDLVCERVQAGVSSRAYARGLLTDKDELIHGFQRACLNHTTERGRHGHDQT